MDDDNADPCLNNISTDAPPNTYEIDCLSTETENSENESLKSNGRTSNPIPTCVSKKIPITINCSTVNFQSDVDNQLAVATITASSPEPNVTNNRIVTPSTNEKKRGELPLLDTDNTTSHSSAKAHRCYDVLLTKRKAVKIKQFRIDMMTNIISLPSQSYIPPSMVFTPQFLHWHCKTSAFAEKPRAWSMEQLADSICEFDTI